MIKPFDLLLDKIHQGQNPYNGFPVAQWSGSWYSDGGATRKIFSEAIERTKPSIIIEVGSFIGESAIHMAKIIKAKKRDCAILCVDTWYAGFDHWVGAREKIKPHFGRPDFYYRFIANVITNDCQNVILPLAIDSVNGARILKWLGLVPSLVYVDGSHEKGDARRDFEAYWDLLPSGAGMLVDDVSNHFPGVVEDFAYFCGLFNVQPVLTEGEKALVIKP